MPPKANREQPSASESEAKQNVNTHSRATTKARNAAAQAAQAELLARHIHSNGPYDRKIVDPLDFETLPDSVLRKYKDHYNLNKKSSLSQEGYLLGSELGRKTQSYKNKDRIAKPELASAVEKHFMAQHPKESEIVTNFLYKVNNQDKAFKLSFNQ
jgi:histone deacetylase complex subunit SAP30